MTPLTRNVALAAAALVIPAALAAAAGPDRMRRLPGQVRDMWTDDTVEGQLKRLTARLNDLSDDLQFHSSSNDTAVQVGRIAAIAAAVLLVPAALAAWIGPERIRETVRDYRDDWARDDHDVDAPSRFDDLSDDLDDLDDDIEAQRDDAFDAVTRAAQRHRD